MTGQTLLDAMEMLNQELQAQTSEADNTRALMALNMAQDYFEILAAQQGVDKYDQTANVVTANGVETTAFPTGFLRINRIQLLDSNGVPSDDLDNLNEAGSHIYSRRWPANIVNTTVSPGAPEAYYTNGRNIYWNPKPDGVYTCRVYGFKQADSITTSGTFAYDEFLTLPFAAFAVRILKMGVGDDGGDVAGIANQTFGDIMGALSGFNRDGAAPYVYRYGHDT
jgi:hypothetical protein